jgi:hypothetical protein
MAFDWKTDVLPWVGPCLTLCGWFLVNRQNNQRELRKEMRSAADKCKLLAREVSSLAFDYWQGDEKSSSWKVRSLLDELEIELSRFSEDKGRQALLDKHIELTDAITGGQFESINRPKRDPNDQEMRTIAKCRERLLREIEIKFQEYYC